MLYAIIIEGLLIIIGIIYIINIKNKYNKNSEEFQKEQEKIFEANWARKQKELEIQFEKERTELEVARRKSEQGARDAQFNLTQLNREIEEKKKFNSSLKEIREEELDRLIESEREKRLALLTREIEEWAQSAQEAAFENFEMDAALYQTKALQAQKNLSEILAQIDEFREKQEVINQEILRRRAFEEKQDFYRIQLSEEAIRDIQILEEIKPRLSKIDLLDKLIYDNYIKKPTDEMIKRVLGGRAPCGIYKITRLKTGEVYIGKSTDVKSRWQQHTKSAFHCGTISHSILHTTIEKDGVENFIWELLEEVPKENLNEKERYWIEFYGSKKYGLNEKVG